MVAARPAAIVGARIGWHWRDRDVIDLQLSVAHEIDSRHAIERAVDARTAITKTAILERDAALIGLDAAQAKLAEVTGMLRTMRDGAEVAVAQAARWKGERDEFAGIVAVLAHGDGVTREQTGLGTDREAPLTVGTDRQVREGRKQLAPAHGPEIGGVG